MEFFSFQSYNECFISDVGQILLSLAHSFAAHHEKRFVLAFFKVSVDHDLFDNLESGKRSSCFGKKSGKDLNFGSKICLNPPNRNPHF